ncbi:MAG: hypothetical protein B6D61_05790 [Bacteroidetes bacterium 4484_249]|nr:MAG: hypothetical protein B6D61_05790 [Bacteroidetes bacterium 4484_249]
MKNYYVALCFITLGFLFTETKAQKNYNVTKGERPPIDLQSLPDDAFEKGILKIKIDESFTKQLDNYPVVVDEKGTVRFNINNIDELNQQYGAKNFNKLFESKAFSSKFSERHRAWGFHLWYTLYFDEKADIKELVNAFEQLPEVTIAEPEYKKELIASDKIIFQTETKDDGSEPPPVDWTPNDPSYGSQWHYHNTGQQNGTPDADIDLPEAWNIERGNSSVIVCIEDGGIQTDHPDLSGNLWSGTGWDFVNDDATIEPHFHGTHVAGTVSAETNNGTGVSGVAGGSGSNDGVRLMSCQVFTNSSSGGFHLAPIYAADNDACISQNSWTYTSPDSYDQSVLDAIDYFNANGGGSALQNGGITIYAAANYDSESHYYPAYYSGTFSVAATNNQDIKSYYSNYGTWVDISAPGGETNSVTARGIYSTYIGSSYAFMQGTSMACPHTSGVAALIVSLAYGSLTPADVANIISTTTDPIDALNPGYAGKLGSGRLNAYQALLETQNYLNLPPVADFEANNLTPGIGQTVNFTDLSINDPTSWTWSFNPSTITYVGGTNSSSQNPQVQFNSTGNYTVTLTATNTNGSDSETKTDYISVFVYCNATGGSTFLEIIRVQLETIDNSSGQEYYSDYTYLSTDLNKNQSYDITITNDGNYQGADLGIWIDYNQDGDFEDTYENIVCDPDNYGQGTFNFTVPGTALLGTTRMRIRTKFSGSDCGSPCGSTPNGEVEDYSVNIIEVYPGLWTGTTSTDWGIATNWDDGNIPVVGTNVTIPASPSGGNYPETNTGAGAECNALTIESGAHLYIPSNNTLTVNPCQITAAAFRSVAWPIHLLVSL